MNLIDATKQLGADEQCLAYLEQMRWPDGVRCPVCGNDKISRITRKSATKNVRKSLYQCLESTCKQQFSATSGTIFNDSHLPLHKWFMALAIVVDAKKGISANQLKQHLGIGSYRTAWYMAHRIRKAMEDNSGMMLSGTVEVDETWIGGKAKRRGGTGPKNQKPRKEKFDMVLSMRERKGRVKFVHIPDGKAATIGKEVNKHISPRAKRIVTDGSAIYDFGLSHKFRPKHHSVNHNVQWIVPGTDIHTNTVESSFSLLKRGLIGSFHRVTIKHLHRYLSEFEFRFNVRKDDDRFSTTLRRMAGIEPTPSSLSGSRRLRRDYLLAFLPALYGFGLLWLLLQHLPKQDIELVFFDLHSAIISPIGKEQYALRHVRSLRFSNWNVYGFGLKSSNEVSVNLG